MNVRIKKYINISPILPQVMLYNIIQIIKKKQYGWNLEDLQLTYTRYL